MCSLTQVFAGTLDYLSAKKSADKDEAGLSQSEKTSLLKSQGRLVGRALSSCLPRQVAAPALSFVVVAQLDARGRVIHTWRNSDSAVVVCFENAVVGAQQFRPPHFPFFTSFEVNFNTP